MQLYIIGNGFDRYHGLNTSYQSFGFYLQDNYSDIYDMLIQYYGLPELDRDDDSSFNDPLWSVFEATLAGLDSEIVLEEFIGSLPNLSSDDFREADRSDFQYAIKSVVENLTTKMFKAFKEFILKVKFPGEINELRLNINTGARFLNFNYTNSLEILYNVSPSNILYIHNSANIKDSILILGHGTDPENFKFKEPEPPEGLSEEELWEWRDREGDNFDISYEWGKDEIETYFTKSFKHTNKIISDNLSFFNSLSNINEVIILGHSLADVDKAYIAKVFNSIKEGANWSVSYYSDWEKESHIEKLTTLGVNPNKMKLFKMNEIKKTSI
ncbi:MAG: bacteriophage abortive infection AbiH family protein [Bacteroidia bacterium]|nr:bacteriophage abortive infection AbiH family protein [Bacteroidia bacterium]